MQYLLSVLPILACPIMMGLMMWAMMHMGKKEPAITPSLSRSHEEPSPQMPVTSPSPLKAILEYTQMCLNWKVLLGMGLVLVVLFLVAPQMVWGALPVVLILACPVSMLFMMGMSNEEDTGCPTCQASPAKEQPARTEAPVLPEQTSSLKW